MNTIRLKYLHRYVDRTGRSRSYFRCSRTGLNISLPGAVGSVEFLVAYQAALHKHDSPDKRRARPENPVTLGELIAEYFDSMSYRNLSATTQATYKVAINKLDRLYGSYPFSDLKPKHVVSMMSKERERTSAITANHIRKHMNLLCEFAKLMGWLSCNPVKEVPVLRNKSRGYHCWTEREIAQFESHWPVGTQERLAFDLLLHTGQRSWDVRTITREKVRNGEISVQQEFEPMEITQHKTSSDVWIPLRPELIKSIDACPYKSGLLLRTERGGREYPPKYFSEWFRKQTAAAGLPNRCVPHGLRKAAATRLADCGCTSNEIIAITGHQTIRSVEPYIRAASKKLNAARAMEKVQYAGARTRNVTMA